MQFNTLIRAVTPGSEYPEHGVKTMTAPLAAPQRRSALLFESFAVQGPLGRLAHGCKQFQKTSG